MEKNKIDRREFLKTLGLGAAATTAALYGCAPKSGSGTSAPQGEVPTDRMTCRTSSSTGDRVSLLGYGCMRWPLLETPAADGNPIDQETVNTLVDYALAHGVNYFDTAPVYLQGFSERSTGIALKRHPRESYFVATKMSNFSNPTRENSLAMYRQSFRELQVDYLDYYLLHSLGGKGIETFRQRFIDNGMLKFLQGERAAGRIRNLGWSFHGSKELFEHMMAMHDSGEAHWDFVQIQMNYVDWRHASGRNLNADYLYGELEKRNIPVVIMEPLLGGRLSRLTDHLVARLKEQRPTQSAASWAFRFAGSYPKVLTVLSGMTYMEHLQDNIRTYSPLEELTEAEYALLEETARDLLRYPMVPCTDCQYCMPCPYGLNIPAIFAHYNKCINEGNVPKSAQDPDYQRARRAFLIGYDRSVPRLRQASHCIGCRQCVSHCPQTIDIPQQLHRIDHFVEQLRQNKL
ncbi:aldo/keto reductase [Alistipes sp. An116]|uniref:aldo/keto reductase n=1 Tax=Alistipes sp. An116 TaxID=1965546 RepID=UPI000B3A6E5F|nr:aldo/keto reductase [Alistipes sp. An116]OUQ54646.1 aldo/keto reductase [Alistipes sp. An116]